MKREEIRAQFVDEYAPLVTKFYNDVKDLPIDGIQIPHLPVIGSAYYNVKYQFAFYGIDTYGWHENKYGRFLEKCEAYKNGDKSVEKDIFFLGEKDIEHLDHVEWGKPSASFWRFIFTVLAKFYHVKVNDLYAKKYPEILTSFIWGNTNSYERYGVTAQDNGVDINTYKSIKKASKRFDSASHLLNVVQPKVLIILNWGESERWLSTQKVKHKEIGNHLWYYYLEDTDTHVFWTAHPRWLAINVGFKTQAQLICQEIEKLNIWPELPTMYDKQTFFGE